MNMALKFVKIALFLFVVYIFHSSFIAGLFFPLNQLNIFLPVLVFFLFLYNHKTVMAYAVVFSVFLGFTSSVPPILSLFALPLAVLILIKIYERFFTNKSLYSIIFLNAILLILYTLISAGFYFIYYFYHFRTLETAMNFNLLVSDFVWELILSSVFVVISFILINLLSNKLKTVFVEN